MIAKQKITDLVNKYISLTTVVFVYSITIVASLSLK